MVKQEIVAEIRRQFHQWLNKWMPNADPSMMCFYLAVFTHGHLKEMNIFGKCLISAGSFSIPRMNLEDDDGIVGTHFGYVFTPNRAAIEAVENNRMPEMHCWVQLPDRQEIVDLSTCYAKEQCKKLTGLDWLTNDPPDFIWHNINELPAGVIYKPDPYAVALVQYFFKMTWGM
jgi:hypothetical protein